MTRSAQLIRFFRTVSGRLLLATAVGTGASLAGWPARVDAAGPTVAPPGGTATLPCAISGGTTRFTGTAAGSNGAYVEGCGTSGQTVCESGCVADGTVTSGNWVFFGGTRGLTGETTRHTPAPSGK